ncbi:hypothetical protein QEZ54_08530 [Catellatospora sp. KI3]|uniref:hypothetical protein n=1 Tax=Catellatospora sp. KI3 TaxID=3041620 RepID=UPI002482E640|nr:hypothetical protein [Catellatospora sp. KI3]MDI1461007.1 hypothetical protein [Catellatospora sp. KI3]
MSVTVRVAFEADIETIARVLMLADVHGSSQQAVRTAVAEVLTRDGIDGAMRRYRNLRYQLTEPGDVERHDTTLAANRLLAKHAYPEPRPRVRPTRPAPAGRLLLDVLAGEPDQT